MGAGKWSKGFLSRGCEDLGAAPDAFTVEADAVSCWTYRWEKRGCENLGQVLMITETERRDTGMCTLISFCPCAFVVSTGLNYICSDCDLCLE